MSDVCIEWDGDATREETLKNFPVSSCTFRHSSPYVISIRIYRWYAKESPISVSIALLTCWWWRISWLSNALRGVAIFSVHIKTDKWFAFIQGDVYGRSHNNIAYVRCNCWIKHYILNEGEKGTLSAEFVNKSPPPHTHTHTHTHVAPLKFRNG